MKNLKGLEGGNKLHAMEAHRSQKMAIFVPVCRTLNKRSVSRVCVPPHPLPGTPVGFVQTVCFPTESPMSVSWGNTHSHLVAVLKAVSQVDAFTGSCRQMSVKVLFFAYLLYGEKICLT